MRFLNNIYVAVAILVLTTGLGSYVDLRSEAMHARHQEISTGLERMVRLNHDLADMLLLAVLEQNMLRVASYGTASAQLESTMRTVDALTRHLRLDAEMAALAEDRARQRAVEERVIALVRADQWYDAQTILFDDGYRLEQKIHEINAETAVGALTGELAATAQFYGRIRAASLVLRAAAVGLLLWVGAMYSRRLRGEAAEQSRLRQAAGAANLELEAKVRERTAQLEAANRKLEDLSATDPLTGLANRRRFDAVYAAEVARAVRQGLPLALCMVDVDHFKAYNDRHGHLAGDECLRHLAGVLRGSALRAGELAARYGGEEFVLLLPGLSREESLALGERIREQVAATGVPGPDGTPIPVTVSLGVSARVPRAGEPPDSLLNEADQALYAAKHQGRNRVVSAP
jgi:diguanylate cyclase (GGDEF)-like protein